MTANWTTPITWNVDQLVTSDDLNEQVRDNLDYLLSPNHQRILYNAGGTYSITGVTAFQDIDSVNLSIDLETHGGPVWLHLQGTGRTSGAGHTARFDFAVDGARLGTGYTSGLSYLVFYDSTERTPVSLSMLVTGLAAGTHTFRPQWRNGSGETCYLYADTSYTALCFEAIEL